ncbi:nicotinate-nucleotide pyrophosphorylase [Pyrobaculum oguniense TE7]|uniref:nicotinate-nucleotide diphosphorylase (carboxylating) n=1 Tax=Pyrobaculum oguniense (strain DSM 13380 / JCM 10595 / TE7) TaxID=698757 RepID=H6Q7D1_PYROT|nr:nicotinate-nucleotide pyrophosphorylase [Pyrobaculum oguniense TE7]
MIEARLFAYELLEELRRDIPFVDWASLAVPDKPVEACVVAKEEGVVAGVEEAVEFLELLRFEITRRLPDGSPVGQGSVVLCFRGGAPDVLKVERVLLNLLMHASGIATFTRKLVLKARSANPKVVVAATRKTLPFLRYIEKKAVMIGGGDPHRFSLSDAAIFKDNHKAFTTLEELAKAQTSFIQKREIEVSSVDEAVKAAELGFDVVMLDNMTPDDVRKVSEILESRGLRQRVVLEASGGVTEDNVHLYAPYVDVISIGRLTHSAPALDMSLEIVDSRIRVGLIGYGRLGRALLELAKEDGEVKFVAVYDIDREKCAEAERTHGVKCVGSIDELIKVSEIVVEAAGASAVLEYGCKVLEAGRHLVVASTGAISKLPRCGGGYVFMISGAAGGVDIVASTGGKVRHVVHKAVFKEVEGGDVTELYWKHPQSLNMSMTYKLAGARSVEVEIRGDAPPGRIIHEVEIVHNWGHAYLRVENEAEGATSFTAALSLYNTLKNAARFLKGGRIFVGTFAVLS